MFSNQGQSRLMTLVHGPLHVKIKTSFSLKRCSQSQPNFVLFVCFVWVEALRPSPQFFSHVGTDPPLPGYYQYFLGGKCIKDTTRHPE